MPQNSGEDRSDPLLRAQLWQKSPEVAKPSYSLNFVTTESGMSFICQKQNLPGSFNQEEDILNFIFLKAHRRSGVLEKQIKVRHPIALPKTRMRKSKH